MDELHGRVERGYDAIGERYAEVLRRGRGLETYFRRFLARVLEIIPVGGSVVDLGCGAGLIADEVARRARVIGVDRSSVQLALARENAPAMRPVRADIGEVEFAARALDAVLAFWSIIHVRRDLHATVLERIHGWLRTGGLFAGTLGRSDSPGDTPGDTEEDFFGAPMTWSHFDAETNRRILRDAGFELIQADVIEDEGESALWVIARA